MEQRLIEIPGDTPGQSWQLSVLKFKARNKTGPDVYLQGALHADELPGTAALHYLSQRLREIEDTRPGDILGNITIVPAANPIGAAQSYFGQPQGRFDNADRENFNRDFERINFCDRASLTNTTPSMPATQSLKRQLLSMALDHDLVLDLHCENEGQQYAYIDTAFWPSAKDLARRLNLDAVLLSDGYSTAFEEAAAHAFASAPPSPFGDRLATTLELRGQSDVYPDSAKTHAMQLEAFLAARGTISQTLQVLPEWSGPAIPLDNVAVVRAAKGGTILFHVNIGETVQADQRIATLLVEPGTQGGELEVRAPASGTVLSRSQYRFARTGDQLFKIICAEKVASNRTPGALEA